MSDLKDKCHVLSTLSFNRKDLPQQPLHLMEAGGDGIKTFPKESQCQTVAQHKKKKKILPCIQIMSPESSRVKSPGHGL